MPPEISSLSALSASLIRLAYVSQTMFRVKLTRPYFSSFVAVAPDPYHFWPVLLSIMEFDSVMAVSWNVAILSWLASF